MDPMLYIFAQATFLHASFRDPCCSPVSHRAHSCPASWSHSESEQRAAVQRTVSQRVRGPQAYAKKKIKKAAKKWMAQVEQERLDADDAFLLEAAETEREKEATAIVDLYGLYLQGVTSEL